MLATSPHGWTASSDMQSDNKNGYEVVDFAELEAVDCPCGQAKRAFADVIDYPGTIHVTDISVDAKLHYHKRLTETNYGRDHHPGCFTMWMAGGGARPGYVHGETDEFSYNVAEDGVHVHDLQATILHQLGIDHRRLTYRFQGLDMRLTGVEEHHPVHAVLT